MTNWSPVQAYIPGMLDDPIEGERNTDNRYRFGWYEVDQIVSATAELDYANPAMYMPGEVFWIEWASDQEAAELYIWCDEGSVTFKEVHRFTPDENGWYYIGCASNEVGVVGWEVYEA